MSVRACASRWCHETGVYGVHVFRDRSFSTKSLRRDYPATSPACCRRLTSDFTRSFHPSTPSLSRDRSETRVNRRNQRLSAAKSAALDAAVSSATRINGPKHGITTLLAAKRLTSIEDVVDLTNENHKASEQELEYQSNCKKKDEQDIVSEKNHVSFQYTPSQCTIADLLEAIIMSVPRHVQPAVAVETLTRFRDSFGIRPTASTLAIIARASAHDPDIDARASRALSVLRAMRRDRVMPTAELLRACFDTCVEGLNVHAALAIMQMARDSGFLHRNNDTTNDIDSIHLSSSTRNTMNTTTTEMMKTISPSAENHSEDSCTSLELPYYNGIIQACVFSGRFAAAAAAFREMIQRDIQRDHVTFSLLVAFYAELGHRDSAENAMRDLRKNGFIPTSVAYAACIRLAGSTGDGATILALYDEFEKHCIGKNVSLSGNFSSVTMLRTSSLSNPSSIALEAAKADVTLSAFQAFRAARDATRALCLLHRLRNEFDYKPTRTIYLLVCETCWRATPQRLDAVEKLRVEMHATLPTPRTRSEQARKPRRRRR